MCSFMLSLKKLVSVSLESYLGCCLKKKGFAVTGHINQLHVSILPVCSTSNYPI